jgi:hypothetical protein
MLNASSIPIPLKDTAATANGTFKRSEAILKTNQFGSITGVRVVLLRWLRSESVPGVVALPANGLFAGSGRSCGKAEAEKN